MLQGSSQWLIGMLLALTLSGLFLAVSAAQLTSPSNGQKVLGQGVAVLTDIDGILPKIHSDLHENAALAGTELVQIPGFPITLQLTSAEASTISEASLRQYILESSATLAYQNGMGIFEDPEGQQDIGLFSPAGAIDRGLSIITNENYNRIRITTGVLIAISGVLALLLLISTRSYVRLIALGAAITAATLPPLGGLIAARSIFRGAQDNADPFIHGLLELGIAATWIPLRNEITFAALGAAFIGVGLLSSLIATRWPTISTTPEDRDF